MSDVSLSRIRKSFGPVEVLHDISIDIRSGEFVSLLGASGCGKTTLLRIVAGLESATDGAVSIAGDDVTGLAPENRDISMMFQSYALLPHLSVAENVRFPLRMRGIGTRKEQSDMVRDALATVQLGHLGDRRPRQLSGGQQQRVALARAIVSRPKVLLLDEPLSNLDARLREDMQVELIEIHQRLGLTTIFVTHDQEEALSLSDRVILLNKGRIEQQGAPEEIYSRPATVYASAFLGGANLIAVDVSDGLARLPDGQVVAVPDGAPQGSASLALRQEDMRITAQGQGLFDADLRTRVYLGARSRFVLRLGNAELRVLAPSGDVPRPGKVGIAIAPDRIRVLPLGD